MCKNKFTGTEDESPHPNMTLQGKQLSDLRCSLTSYLENTGYSEKTIHRYNHELDLLQAMMNENGIMYYTNDTGEQFCQLRSHDVKDYGLQLTIRRIIFRLNCLYLDSCRLILYLFLKALPMAYAKHLQFFEPFPFRECCYLCCDRL